MKYKKGGLGQTQGAATLKGQMEEKEVFRQQRQVSLKVQASEKKKEWEKAEVSWGEMGCAGQRMIQEVGPDASRNLRAVFTSLGLAIKRRWVNFPTRVLLACLMWKLYFEIWV